VNSLQPNTSTNMFKAHNNVATGESLFQLKGASWIWSCDLNRSGTGAQRARTRANMREGNATQLFRWPLGIATVLGVFLGTLTKGLGAVNAPAMAMHYPPWARD
jgi:hypothetical protein